MTQSAKVRCCGYGPTLLKFPKRPPKKVKLRSFCQLFRIRTRSKPSFQINIGEDVVIGAGSVVISDVPDKTKIAGVPAKIIN